MHAKKWLGILRSIGERGKRESGQTLVIIALSMTAMLGIAGLVIDGGTAFVYRRAMQNAADAAAIAGTRVLAIDSSITYTAQTATKIDSYVTQYLTLNGWVSATNNFKYAYYVDANGNCLQPP